MGTLFLTTKGMKKFWKKLEHNHLKKNLEDTNQIG